MKFRRPGASRIIELALGLVLVAVAIRAVTAALPVPLQAEKRRVRIWLYAPAQPSGAGAALARGERVWHARNGASFGTILEVVTRPSPAAERSSGWGGSRDLLLRLLAVGRYRAGKGLYLGGNTPVRIGETYPLRTTLTSFWGRVERITLYGD